MSQKFDENKLSRLEGLIGLAKSFGATDAEVVFSESSALSANKRLGKLESIIRSEDSNIGLRVFVGQKAAIVSSSEMSDDAFKKMAERAVDMAKIVPEDAYIGVAEKSELATKFPDLDLFDATELEVEKMCEYADEIEQAALSCKGITNSDGAEVSCSKGDFYYLASNGFKGVYRSSEFSASVSVIAGKGSNMQGDYSFDNKAFFSDMRDFKDIGTEAANRAIAALKPKKISTKKIPVVFENRISRSILSSLAAAISGSAVARGTTLLKDKIGEQIFSSNINIIDDPFMLRGARSYPFDAEGIAPKKRSMIENGILTGWFLDLRCARKLGLKSSGNATRDSSTPPIPRPANFYMQPSNLTFDELIADIKEGFLVTELMGSGVSIITGDYSRGARGFMIENGKVSYPVAEVTIAGNLKDMWKNAIPADDLQFRFGIDAPTIRVDGMTVAGS